MSRTATLELKIDIPDRDAVSAILVRPTSARHLFVLAHGAGAGMRHAFMEEIAAELATRHIATLRYQFPYMEQGRKRPDGARIAVATVRAAVDKAREISAGELILLAGGKSFGGRMTSTAASQEALVGISGVVFLGFPLHPPGRPGSERAAHLEAVDVPMLFVQGTRDSLADLRLLKPMAKKLGTGTTLHIVEGGDHSFKVLKRSGRTPAEVMSELAEVVSVWCEGRVEPSTPAR